MKEPRGLVCRFLLRVVGRNGEGEGNAVWRGRGGYRIHLDCVFENPRDCLHVTRNPLKLQTANWDEHNLFYDERRRRLADLTPWVLSCGPVSTNEQRNLLFIVLNIGKYQTIFGNPGVDRAVEWKLGREKKKENSYIFSLAPSASVSLLAPVSPPVRTPAPGLRGWNRRPDALTLPLPEWSISNFPYSITRNITSHCMKNLAFHSLLRRKDDYTSHSHYLISL